MKRIMNLKAGWLLSGLTAAMLLAGCKEESEPVVVPQDATVTLEMNYQLLNASSAVTAVDIVYPDPADVEQSVMVTINPGEVWSSTVTYNNVSDHPVGFFATPILSDDVAKGENVSLQYQASCKADLLDGDRQVDTQSISESDTHSFTFADDNDQEVSADLLFSVTSDGLKRVRRSDLMDEDSADTSSDLPSSDTDDVKGIGNLYYASKGDIAPNDEFLFDNFLARYATRAPWAGNALGKGDLLFLYGDELQSASHRALEESLAAGVILVIEGVQDYSTFRDFCANTDVYNPLGDRDVEDCAHSMFIVADADVNISGDPNLNYKGIFVMLQPDAPVEGVSDDYRQGKLVDRAVEIINKVVSPTPDQMRSHSRADAEADLQSLVSAYKVYLCGGQNRHVISASSYQSSSKAKRDRVNYYSLEYDIWNVMSLSEKRNYYYVHQEFLGAFKDGYLDVYTTNVTTDGFKTVAKVCEWYGSSVRMTAAPYGSVYANTMKIHRTSPETTQSSTSYSSGFSWNLGGSIAYGEKGAQGTVSGGIGVSSSYSYSVADVTISNQCIPDNTLAWQFDLSSAYTKFAPFSKAGTNMHEGSLTGRQTMNAGTDYMISFPENVTAPQLSCSLYVTLKRTCGKAGKVCHVGTTTAVFNDIFTLPYLKSSDFE